MASLLDEHEGTKLIHVLRQLGSTDGQGAFPFPFPFPFPEGGVDEDDDDDEAVTAVVLVDANVVGGGR